MTKAYLHLFQLNTVGDGFPVPCWVVCQNRDEKPVSYIVFLQNEEKLLNYRGMTFIGY